MKQKSREGLSAYYKEAGSWAESSQDMLRRSRKVAWIVAGVAVTAALAEALALMALAPLKTVEPYTLLVDRTTGFVQALKPLDQQKIAPDTALTQSFLVQYVIARESYDAATVQSSYRKVGLWSADPARSGYVSAMQLNNPDSPLNRYGRNSSVDARVKSVSPLGGDSALVRFETLASSRGGQRQGPRSWVAVVRYRFSGEPMRVEDRYVNPLGFQVTRYRVDEESAPPESPASSVMAVDPSARTLTPTLQTVPAQ